MSERDETREAVARAISGAPFPSKASLRKADAVLKLFSAGSRFTVEGAECVVFPKPDASLLWKMTEILGEWIMDQKSEDDVFRAMLRACEEKGDGNA